ncbi:MAG: hypothetical protein EYC70_08530 [Planctomycetota bacterium]|nr:MAG: hypothetical protein EYC70_08530 [Planctomycetota bacterium]
MLGTDGLVLVLLAMLQEAGAAPWLRADVRLDAPGKLWLEIRHQGWTGRTLEVSLQRGEIPPTRTERRLLTPSGDGGDKVRLDIPPGEDELWVTLRERAGGKLVLEAPVALYPHGWFVCGPFPVPGTGFGKKLAPENGPLAFSESFETADGVRSWRPFDAADLLRGERLDFPALLGGRDHAVAYVGTQWRFEKRTKAVLKLGSDDILEVFLNGRRVHANPALRGAAAGQDSVDVTFQAGSNDLLIKVGNEGGAWGLYFQALAPEGGPLQGFEQLTQSSAGWKPGGPPRIVDVGADRAVLEVGSAAPAPAHVLLRRARTDAPDPRDWMTRGAAMALPYEVEETAIPGDGVLRSLHRFELAGLDAGTRYGALGIVEPADPSAPAPPQPRTSPWRLFRTSPKPGRTAVLHLRVAAVFFADVVERGPGEQREMPKAEIQERIDAALRDFEETRRFYFVHSGCRVSLDLESFVDWERHVVNPDTDYGFSYSGGEWAATERTLGEAGRAPTDFDCYLLVSCDRTWDGGRWVFPDSGGGTLGPLPPFGAGKSGWKIGCDNAWLYCHEFGHAFDATWAESGYPEFLFNHFYQWDGSAHAHGEHWDGNGWLLREWAGHARRDQPTRWFPADRAWRYCLNAWGSIRDYDDADGDGVPDAAEALPLDEARFLSLPSAADTDADGMGDLEELMRSAWLVNGLDETQCGGAPRLLSPVNSDTDGDGRADGADPQPHWAVPDDLRTPNEFVVSDAATGVLRVRLAWHDGALRVTLHAEKDMVRARVMLDADNDGWYVGSDNIRVEFDQDRVLSRDFLQCAVPDKEAFSQPENAPADMFTLESSPTEGTTLAIRPRAASGFAGEPGEPIGIHIAIDAGGGWLTLFEPHAFLRTRL